MCVGSDYNRFTDWKLVAWDSNGHVDIQKVWLSSSWFKDLLLETGIGDAEEQLVDKEKKEYKYVITKNNFKLLQNQVSTLEKENQTFKVKLVNLANDIEDLKIAMSKKEGKNSLRNNKWPF